MSGKATSGAPSDSPTPLPPDSAVSALVGHVPAVQQSSQIARVAVMIDPEGRPGCAGAGKGRPNPSAMSLVG